MKQTKEYFVAFGTNGRPIGMPVHVKDEIDADAALECIPKGTMAHGMHTKEWLLEHEYFCESDFEED